MSSGNSLNAMMLVPPRSKQELQHLAEALSKGKIFLGLMLVADPTTAADGDLLKQIFCPLQFLPPEQWAQWQKAQYVPYEWVRELKGRLPRKFMGTNLSYFHTMEVLTWEDAQAVLRQAQVLHRQVVQAPAAAAATTPAPPAAPPEPTPTPVRWLSKATSWMFVIWLLLCIKSCSFTEGSHDFGILFDAVFSFVVIVLHKLADAVKNL